MKCVSIVVHYLAITLLALLVCEVVLAQDAKSNSNLHKQTSRTGLTGVGSGENTITDSMPGKADGVTQQSTGGQRHPLYRLRPSDVMEISFVVAPEFNQVVTVQPDGYVMLRDAGMVEVEGLTLAELRDAVEAAYRGYLHDPHAAVALKEFERPYYIVGGEVGKPGKYELRSDTTVTEAVQIAGGFTQQSKHSQVVLFRHLNDDLIETRLMDLKKMLKQRNLQEDMHLRPGDLVFVPQNSISKIARFLSKPSASVYMNSSQF